jgi:hypothetical protein
MEQGSSNPWKQIGDSEGAGVFRPLEESENIVAFRPGLVPLFLQKTQVQLQD